MKGKTCIPNAKTMDNKTLFRVTIPGFPKFLSKFSESKNRRKIPVDGLKKVGNKERWSLRFNVLPCLVQIIGDSLLCTEP